MFRIFKKKKKKTPDKVKSKINKDFSIEETVEKYINEIRKKKFNRLQN